LKTLYDAVAKNFWSNYILIFYILMYRVSQEERSVFWEVILSVILSKKVYMYMWPISSGSRIDDKREILRTVPITDIHCSRDEVATLYPA
jgi:hypothetical protein